LDVQDVKVLPKVKGLTVCVDNLENPSIWKQFQTQFPNLEWIRLEPVSEAELLATSAMSDDDEEDDKDELEGKSVDSDEQLKADGLVFPPVTPPDAEVRKGLFIAFSKLKNIIWVKRQSLGESGEVFFTRQKSESAGNASE